MGHHDTKIAMLRRVPCLRGKSDQDLCRLARLVEEVEVRANHVLTRESTTGLESFIVIDGWAAVSRGGETIAAIGPGEFIGEMAMLDHQPRTATVVAKTPMRLFALGPAAFATFAAEPDIGRTMATQLTKRLREVEDRC